MPGIFGYAGQSLPADPALLIDRMSRSLRHHSWYTETRFQDDGAGVALGRMALDFVGAAPQPASNRDGSLITVMDGEIYDYDVQRQTLAASGVEFYTSDPAELLLRGYNHGGQDFLRSLHGKFVAVVWDGKRQKLFLTNDRFGMRPLFYARLPGRLVFGSEIKAVLADAEVGRGRNLRGIAQFFTYGHLLDDDTLLEAVRLLPAA